MFVSLLSIALNIGLPLLFLKVYHLGFACLALTTSISVSVESLLLCDLLRRKLGGIEGRYLRDRLARIAFAALSMAAVILVLRNRFEPLETLDRWGSLIETVVCLCAGLLVFTFVSRLVQVTETSVVIDAFVYPFRRVFGLLHARIQT
jgi:putative peptidoglycan lipid II flippase